MIEMYERIDDSCESFEAEFKAKPAILLPFDKVHKFPYTLEQLAPMLKESVVARHLYASRSLSLEALDAFSAGDVTEAVSLYAAAYRIADLPVQWIGKDLLIAEYAFTNLIDSDEHVNVRTDAMFVLHFLFAMQGKGNEALQCLRDARQMRPDDPSLYYQEGNILHYLDRLTEADKALQRAIQLGDAWEPYYVRGCVLYNLALMGPMNPKLIADACALLEEYIRRAPAEERKVSEAYYHLAILERVAGRPGSGRRCLEQGWAAEKLRLPCFKAPPSNFRKTAEAMLGKFHPCGHLACTDLGKSMCSGCRKIWYCSPECQKNHWKMHKKDCKAK